MRIGERGEEMRFGETGRCGARSMNVGGRAMHWEGILCMFLLIRIFVLLGLVTCD